MIDEREIAIKRARERERKGQEPWLGVDLDGTLAMYDGWHGVDHIGDPIQPMIDRVKLALADGKFIRIFTARVSRTGAEGLFARKAIEGWCLKHIGQVLPVTCTKDFAMEELWDDRCRQVVPNTGEFVRVLKEDEVAVPAIVAAGFNIV
jgi:hypothetical protein